MIAQYIMARVYNKERREGITLVHMVVAQPCEKYHTFCYSYIRAKTGCYMILVMSEHFKMVDVVS